MIFLYTPHFMFVLHIWLMKKILIAVIVVLLLLLAGIYFYIPNTITVSTITTLHGTVPGANRVLLQKENWKKFWIGEKELTHGATLTNNDLFKLNKNTFRITKLLQNALGIAIAGNNRQVNSMLAILPVRLDSIALKWTYSTSVSANPFTRIQQYRHAVSTKQDMETALQNIKQFLSNNKNVYGIDIQQTTTHDTTLVSTYNIINHYPATKDIYALVKKLQLYIEENKALQTGSPMLNITSLDSQQYKVMVALPTNKMLGGQSDITYKRMIPGNFLTTTVAGGNTTIDSAYRQMQHYFTDYQRTAMAIPFQVLVTDRSKQMDTAKWITKLYFPVM
jgi:hypothetical protein